jgi:alkanesulfonate monooxygenase SsuD/methylene tetrahydromethanopterin reductase-like flavin-dependent oxidoreductase (luciferase family)
MRTSVQALVVITDSVEVIEKSRTGAFADRTLAGSVDQIVDAMGRYAELGFDEFIVPDANLGRDRAQRRERLERIDADIVSQFSSS